MNARIRIAFEYHRVSPMASFGYMAAYNGAPFELAERLLAGSSCDAVTIHVFAAGRWWLLDRVDRAALPAAHPESDFATVAA